MSKKEQTIINNTLALRNAGVLFTIYSKYHVKVGHINFYLTTESFNYDGESSCGKGLENFVNKVKKEFPSFVTTKIAQVTVTKKKPSPRSQRLDYKNRQKGNTEEDVITININN